MGKGNCKSYLAKCRIICDELAFFKRYFISPLSNTLSFQAFLSVFITSLILRVGVLFVACDSEKWSPGYRVAVTVATYTFPLVVELTAYAFSYHNINRRLKASEGSRQVLLFIKRSLKVFVLIAVVFAVCTLPASILVIIQSLRVYTPSYFVGYIGDMIECIPCVTNVICYLFCSPKFRMEIKKLLSGMFVHEYLAPKSNLPIRPLAQS